MNLGLLGTKLGMTQVFDDNGNPVPVSVIQAGPCTVIQKKTKEKDGYEALQIGFSEAKKPAKVNRPMHGHFKKSGTPIFSHLVEFRTGSGDKFEVGQVITVRRFAKGDFVDVSGISKGKGFQGVIKRHGKGGGPAAHGSKFHRSPGSIGMRTTPGRVLKNTKLPGQMGNVNRTVKNLKVVGIDETENVVFLKGAVPGATGSLVIVKSKTPQFVSREDLVKNG